MAVITVTKSFYELSHDELLDLFQARNEVFVVEQNCIYQDIDEYDKKSFHVMCYEDNKLAAYCRIVPAGLKYATEWSIGRVLTMPYSRKKGVGRILVSAALDKIQKSGGGDIRISAQTYIKKFYESMGFCAVGDEYLEGPIPHVDMLLRSA